MREPSAAGSHRELCGWQIVFTNLSSLSICLTTSLVIDWKELQMWSFVDKKFLLFSPTAPPTSVRGLCLRIYVPLYLLEKFRQLVWSVLMFETLISLPPAKQSSSDSLHTHVSCTTSLRNACAHPIHHHQVDPRKCLENTMPKPSRSLLMKGDSKPNWYFLEGVLSAEEQLGLFNYVHEHDATDWANLSRCMNPSPKTLELMKKANGTTSRTLLVNPNYDKIATEMVKKATRVTGKIEEIKSISVSVIRYCKKGTSPFIGGCFPPHIDHCNDKSWVVLFSLGCTAIFQIKSRDMEERKTFEMKSGDVLVFDPSSEAGVTHGVDGIVEDENSGAKWSKFGNKFEVLGRSRFGVQCRVFWGDGG
jgi:hypothetical protein